jgi:hypothetical protein
MSRFCSTATCRMFNLKVELSCTIEGYVNVRCTIQSFWHMVHDIIRTFEIQRVIVCEWLFGYRIDRSVKTKSQKVPQVFISHLILFNICGTTGTFVRPSLLVADGVKIALWQDVESKENPCKQFFFSWTSQCWCNS